MEVIAIYFKGDNITAGVPGEQGRLQLRVIPPTLLCIFNDIMFEKKHISYTFNWKKYPFQSPTELVFGMKKSLTPVAS